MSNTNVTLCDTMNANPVDGSCYFNTTESKVYMAFNGQWSKLETLMTIDELKIIQTRKKRKEKLIKLNDL